MLGTPDKLVVAGVPAMPRGGHDGLEFKDPDKALKAYTGKLGSSLVVLSNKNGKKISGTALPAMPVFDGMSAAGGRIFVSLKNGRLICYE